MIISHTTDLELVKRLITSDGVWENLSTKGLNKETFQPVPDWQYVIGKVDGEAVGLGIIHKIKSGYNKCHVQVLPKYRKEHGIKFGLDGMKFIWENNTFDFMVASISSKFPNVRKFAELMGFEHVETKKNWYKEHDAWLFVAKRK